MICELYLEVATLRPHMLSSNCARSMKMESAYLKVINPGPSASGVAAQQEGFQEGNGTQSHKSSNGTNPSGKRARESSVQLDAGPPSKKQHVVGAEDVASAPPEEALASEPNTGQLL